MSRRPPSIALATRSTAPVINELFPGVAELYRQYLEMFGPTFSEWWLVRREWQVLLPQALEKKCCITDEPIRAYIDAFATRSRSIE